MAFPYVAVASAGIGIAQSLFGAKSKDDSRKAQNAAMEAQYEAQQTAARVSAKAQMQLAEWAAHDPDDGHRKRCLHL